MDDKAVGGMCALLHFAVIFFPYFRGVLGYAGASPVSFVDDWSEIKGYMGKSAVLVY